MRFSREIVFVSSLFLLLTVSGCSDSSSSPAASGDTKTDTTASAPADNGDKSGVAGPPTPPADSGATAKASFDTKPFKGNGKPVKTKTGLQYEEMTLGKGAVAKAGDQVSVHYTGTLKDGTKFDSSRDRNQTLDFPLGAGRVIKGWDEGVAGMKVGGRRKLTIPANLAYGDAPPPGAPIPPGATLIFDVELMDVKKVN